MSITANNIFEWVMAIADELETDGTINASNTNDYKYRTPSILNTLQAELLKSGDIYATPYEISHKPAEMVVGSFETGEFVGTDLTYEGDGACYGYYFETDGEGTVYIEDYTSGWNVKATVSVANTVTDFTAVKALITPTTGATRSRIRFSGTYRYLFKNYGLFKRSFTLARLPDYRAWIKKDMPSDFKSVDQIIEETSSNYDKSVNYKWEGKSSLYIPWEYDGNIRIVYRPIPETIDAITDTVQVDDVTARTMMVYGLGMELYKDENDVLYRHFKDKYDEQKKLSEKKQLASVEITNYYGSF